MIGTSNATSEIPKAFKRAAARNSKALLSLERDKIRTEALEDAARAAEDMLDPPHASGLEATVRNAVAGDIARAIRARKPKP